MAPLKTLLIKGNTAQNLCVRNAVRSFVRLYRNFAGILPYVKEFLCKMAGNVQVYGVQSRQTYSVRCCPKIIFTDEPTGALNRAASDEVINELIKLNHDGTTIMLITYDVKVAAKCTRVLYIVDENIKEEYNIDRYENSSHLRDRERTLNNRLVDMGW